MEDFVWSDPAILKNYKWSSINLFVCRWQKRIAKKEQYVSKETGKEIVSVGINGVIFKLQKGNAQPYYIILDNDGMMLSDKPESYNSDINAYKAWLRSGIEF
jgi:thiol:disulfide interchange protein DsbD